VACGQLDENQAQLDKKMKTRDWQQENQTTDLVIYNNYSPQGNHWLFVVRPKG
jgi:hypothetical protein